MMPEHEFEVLQVKASIAPAAETWPKPDFSKVSITGDMPHLESGDPHWAALHDAVHEARSRVLKALGAMSAVDEDKALSPVGKAEKKKEIATKAITAHEKSQHLAKARSAVEGQVKRWDKALGLTPKAPESVGDAMLHCEIRSHLASLKSGDRVAFINTHLEEVSAAVISAPAFLSGLSPAELNIVRQRVEARANPEIAAAKAATLTALAEIERGWRNAAKTIRERGGLEKPLDGAGKVALRAEAFMD